MSLPPDMRPYTPEEQRHIDKIREIIGKLGFNPGGKVVVERSPQQGFSENVDFETAGMRVLPVQIPQDRNAISVPIYAMVLDEQHIEGQDLTARLHKAEGSLVLLAIFDYPKIDDHQPYDRMMLGYSRALTQQGRTPIETDFHGEVRDRYAKSAFAKQGTSNIYEEYPGVMIGLDEEGNTLLNHQGEPEFMVLCAGFYLPGYKFGYNKIQGFVIFDTGNPNR